MEVRIKASKTNVFWKGVTIYLGVTGADLCPVAAILNYMVHCSVIARGKQSPFFCFSNGQALTRDNFVWELCMTISAGGIDASSYVGHNFQIGTATTAAACGLLESLIKTLGRWESSAYMLYIQTLQSTLCSVARKLVQGPESEAYNKM